MKKTGELDIKGTVVRVVKINGEDFVCLSDMAKLKSEDAQQTISNWMRKRMTLEYLGLWEELYNPDFKPLGFEGFRKEVGLNHFTMSPGKWSDGGERHRHGRAIRPLWRNVCAERYRVQVRGIDKDTV